MNRHNIIGTFKFSNYFSSSSFPSPIILKIIPESDVKCSLQETLLVVNVVYAKILDTIASQLYYNITLTSMPALLCYMPILRLLYPQFLMSIATQFAMPTLVYCWLLLPLPSLLCMHILAQYSLHITMQLIYMTCTHSLLVQLIHSYRPIAC